MTTNPEYVVYGTKPEKEDWAEDIITVTTDPVHRDKAIAWAKANGFRNVRVMNYAGEKPDFVSTIRI